MQRWFLLLLISFVSLLLTGCGIKGGLDTPPPLWGEEVAQADTKDEDTDVDADDNVPGYGVDVAKNP